MRTLRELLTGPPPALPDTLDRAAERWAAAPPRVRWFTAGLVALTLLGLAGRGAVASPWGPPVDVIVASVDLSAGHVLVEDDLVVATWPRDLVVDAARHADEVLGSVTTRPLDAGAPIRLHATSDGGLAVRLGPDRAAVPVLDTAAPPVTPGWVVDVVGQGYDGEPLVLARSARVLAASGEQVWLDVARDEAPAVVAASARGDASLVLLPPG